MQELVPGHPVFEGPFAEELQEEVRSWVEPPKPPAKPDSTAKAADAPPAVRFDLD